MIFLPIGLFAIAAALGLSILFRWLNKKDASKTVVYSHGIVAATALVFLIVYALQNPEKFPLVSIILFVLAASGGLYMFFKNKDKENKPIPIAFIHALLAVSGLISLLLFVFA